MDAGVVFENGEHSGTAATAELVRKIAADELADARAELGEEAIAAGNWQQAHELLLQVSLDESYAEFLTLPAYELLD